MEEINPNKKRYYSKVIGIIILSLVISNTLFAHTVVGELEKMSGKDAAILYLELGYTHILPLGLDHILFVLSLYLLSPKLKPVLYQATAFTVAHSVTLGLSMYHVIKPPANIVEPVIALSIMYVALGKYLFTQIKKIENRCCVFIRACTRNGLCQCIRTAWASGEILSYFYINV